MSTFSFASLQFSSKKKHVNAQSDKKLKLPRLRLKFGPTTPLCSPYDTLRSLTLPRDQLGISASPVRSPCMSPSFIDSLASRYEVSKHNNANVASKFIKSEEINVFWSIINTKGFIPDARTGATMNIIDRNLYIFGGERSDQSNDIKKLDYRSLKWEKILSANSNLSEVPMIKTGHTSVNYKHYLVMYGGFNSFDSSLQIRNCFSLVYFFDVSTGIWKSHKPIGAVPEPRRSHTAAVIGCSMVIYSGLDGKGNLVPNLSVLNLETMNWGLFRLKGEVPKPRKGCTMTSVFHSTILDHYTFDIFSVPKSHDHIFTKQTSGIYLFGGLNQDGEVTNDVFILKGQPSKTKPGIMELIWTKIMPTGKEPIPRHGHCANLCGGLLIIMGGRNDAVSGGIVEELAILRIASWRWESVRCYGDSPSARIGACSGTIGNRVLLLGGMYLTGFASSALYELETDPKRVADLMNFRKFGNS